MSDSEQSRMSLVDALEQMRRIQDSQGSREWRVVIRKFNPGGMTAHQTTEVKGIYGGIDWDAGKVIIEPARPLTELTAEQVAAIQKSVREGGSWHAYQRDKQLRDQIAALEREVARLRAKEEGSTFAGQKGPTEGA